MKPKFKTKFVLILVLFCSISLILAFAKANNSTSDIKEGRIIIDEPQKNGSFFISSANTSQNEIISPIYRTDFTFNALFVKWQAQSAKIEQDFNIYVQFLNENWSEWYPVILDDDYNGKNNGLAELSSQMIPTKLTDSFQYKIVFDPHSEIRDLSNLEFIYLNTVNGPKNSVSISTRSDGLNIIPREVWGANENYKYDDSGQDLWEEEYYTPEKFILHHTAGEKANANPMATVRAIHYFHAVSRGWGDIGYNYLIDSNGNIYEGRRGGDGVVAGHSYMNNRNSIGIAILGCYQSDDQESSHCNTPDNLTEATKQSLNQLIAFKSREFNIDPLGRSEFNGQMLPNVIGHSDVSNTVCPGNLIYNNMPQTRQLAYNLLQDLGGYQPALPTSAEFVRQSTHDITIEETKTKEITVEFKNTGQAIWRGYEDGGLFLADSAIKNKMAKIGSVSLALNTTQLSPEVVKYRLIDGNVYPGEIGRFKLTLRPPTEQKTLTRNFTLAWQNKGYFPNSDFSVGITRVPCTTCQTEEKKSSVPTNYSASLISSTFPKTMTAEQLQTVLIQIQNTGNQILKKENLKLHIIYEKKYISPFRNNSWYNEYASIPSNEEQIYPSSTATFEFKLKSPHIPAPFPHTLTLFYKDKVLIQWDKTIEVTSAYSAQITENSLPVAVKNTWKPKVKLTFTNTGTKPWSNPTLRSYDIDGTNSWFRDNSWADNKTIKTAWTKVEPGQSISFDFYIDPYWKPNTYPHVYKLFSGDQQIDINTKKEFLTYTRVDN